MYRGGELGVRGVGNGCRLVQVFRAERRGGGESGRRVQRSRTDRRSLCASRS